MAETAPQKTEPSVTAVPKEGFGDVLRRVREEQGISLGDMAARSRLYVQQLKAIESESLDQLRPWASRSAASAFCSARRWARRVRSRTSPAS